MRWRNQQYSGQAEDKDNHCYGGYALRQPVTQAVVRTGNDSPHHIVTPISKVRMNPAASTSLLVKRAF